MFPKMRLAVIVLGGVFVLPVALWGADAPAPPASQEAFESDVRTYLPFFHGWLGSDLRTAAPSGSVSRWTVGASLDGTYSDNVDRTEEKQEAFSSDVGLSLSWLRRSPRLDASIEGRYLFPVYRSEALEGRDLRTYSAGASGRWQPAATLSFSGGGNLDRSAETGIQAAPEGVRSSYENRFDNYNAHAEYSWQPLQSLSNTGSYRYHYRNYVSGDAEGEDARSHEAGTSLEYRPGALDTLGLGYTYALEETIPNADAPLQEREERTNHRVNASWGHRFRFASSDPFTLATLSYAWDKALFLEGDDYSHHAVSVALSRALSARTDVGARGGYEWLVAGGTRTENLWSWGMDLTHRFTAYTRATVSASRGWEYAPATSRTERTTLTDVLRVSAELVSQLTRYLEGTIAGAYVAGKPERGLEGAGGEGNYYQGSGSGIVRLRLGERSSASVDARLSHRSSELDEYWLFGSGVSVEARLWTWLSGTLRYSHERRGASGADNYKENRLYGALSSEW